jgi:hypothetical protein
MGEPGAQHYQCAPFGVANAKREAGRNQHWRRLGFEHYWSSETGMKIETGGKTRNR